MRVPLLLSLLPLTWFACAEATGPAPADMAEARLVVYAEFIPYLDLERQLPLLAQVPAVGLCLAIRPEQPPGPELESLLRRAAKLGVPVMPWLLLPESEGYWFNEENLPQAGALARDFVDWVEARRVPVNWLMFDMEMNIDKIRAMQGADLNEVVIPTLKANLDRERYRQSTAAYAALVKEIQARGFHVTAAVYPFVLDDLADGDTDIQDEWNTPIAGVPFDEVYFMVYRTTFARLLGFQTGPDLVYQYAREAKAAFGRAGIIALGTVGTIGLVSEEGYPLPGDLRPDIAAARAGGNPRVFVYSLDGMLEAGDLPTWLALTETSALVPEPQDSTQLVRTIIGAMDNLK